MDDEPIDFAATGRAVKASKLVDLLDELFATEGLDPYGDAEEIARRLRAASDEQWLDWQRGTGNKRKAPPSAITRGMVIEIFEKRVDVAGESVTTCRQCGVEFDDDDTICSICADSEQLNESLAPGIHLDVPEERYHADPCATPSLSVSIAQALVLESPAHAYLRHPRLGGQPFEATSDMDRGTLIHALLLGKGRQVGVVDADDWRTKAAKEMREQLRAEGKLAVTRKLYDDSIKAAQALQRKLAARGFVFDGHSEVTLVWEEMAREGVVRCRGRLDHVKGNRIFDLKITADANPRRVSGGCIADMGYDLQGVVYPRALEILKPEFAGRVGFSLLFCEPEPPYCITEVRLAASRKAIAESKWARAKAMWERCLRTNHWPDYTDQVVFAEARPWEIDAETYTSTINQETPTNDAA